MNIVTSFTDYRYLFPDYIIDFIERELALRDIPGITNNAITKLSVSGEHPLGRLLTTYLATPGSQQTEGIIPAISVVQGDDDCEAVTIGDKLEYVPVDAAFISTFKQYSPHEREKYGLISDKQIALIEDALRNNAPVVAQIYQFYSKQTWFVGLWTHSPRERTYIGLILTSILRMLRKNSDANMTMRTSHGLENFNFGKKLFGQESEITLNNFVRDITIMTDFDLQEQELTLSADYTISGDKT